MKIEEKKMGEDGVRVAVHNVTLLNRVRTVAIQSKNEEQRRKMSSMTMRWLWKPINTKPIRKEAGVWQTSSHIKSCEPNGNFPRKGIERVMVKSSSKLRGARQPKERKCISS